VQNVVNLAFECLAQSELSDTIEYFKGLIQSESILHSLKSEWLVGSRANCEPVPNGEQLS